MNLCFFFFFQAEDGIRDYKVTGVQTCALPICGRSGLCRLLGGVDGQLQDLRFLTERKIGQKHDRAISKFQRVVMLRRFVEIDLPEARETFANLAAEQKTFRIGVRLESYLGARTQAERNRAVRGRRKTSRLRPRKSGGDDRLRQLRRSGGHGVQTVVTHEELL